MVKSWLYVGNIANGMAKYFLPVGGILAKHKYLNVGALIYASVLILTNALSITNICDQYYFATIEISALVRKQENNL